MNKTWTALATIGLALALFSSACNGDGDDGGSDGDGDPLSLEEYFAQVQEADSSFSSSTDELGEQFEELSADQVSEAADLLDQQLSLLSDFADELDAIEAPEEVAELHDETVDALRGYAEVFGPAVDEFREAPTIDEGFASFAEVDQATLETAQGNCLELAQIAADNSIEVDLSCGQGESS